ncbi:DUF1636 domain-containing protein [Sphingomonas adhaesiva]|uniref:DUF1636 domain-containing protein n=1 Tax=Sphingomonas adhaesiva TaxID=28212 RepID=UPI002FF72F20
MLTRASDGVAVVACSTCRHAADAPDERGGARLAEALRRVKASDPAYDAIAVEQMPCLFACGEACTVHLRAPGRVGYILVRFAPDEEAARAILDYARHYAASAEGQVPYRDWPQGVKGHFLARVPPAGFVVE